MQPNSGRRLGLLHESDVFIFVFTCSIFISHGEKSTQTPNSTAPTQWWGLQVNTVIWVQRWHARTDTVVRHDWKGAERKNYHLFLYLFYFLLTGTLIVGEEKRKRRLPAELVSFSGEPSSSYSRWNWNYRYVFMKAMTALASPSACQTFNQRAKMLSAPCILAKSVKTRRFPETWTHLSRGRWLGNSQNAAAKQL